MADQTTEQALQPFFRVCVTFAVLDSLSIALRFFVVLKLRRPRISLAWDDWLMVPAYLCNVAVITSGFVIYHFGIEPVSSQTENHIVQHLLKTLYITAQFLFAGCMFTRLAILALYLRLFTDKWTRRGSKLLITFIILQFTVYSVVSALQCLPVPFFWNKSVLGGHCIDTVKLSWSVSPPSIASDVVLIFLPLPSVWRLKMPRSRKIHLTILFSSFVLALSATITRQIMFERYSLLDITPRVTSIIISWIIIEPSLYLFTACIPAMAPLTRLLARHVMCQRTSKSLGLSPGEPANLDGTQSLDGNPLDTQDAVHKSKLCGLIIRVKRRHSTGNLAHEISESIRRGTQYEGTSVEGRITMSDEERIERILGLKRARRYSNPSA